jgi:hypothetical protein
MIFYLINILWFIIATICLQFWLYYLNKIINIKIIKWFFFVLTILAFVTTTIILEKLSIFDADINAVGLMLPVCYFIIIQFKHSYISQLFFLLFILFPGLIIISPYLNYLLPLVFWLRFFFILVLFITPYIFLHWVLKYGISERIKIISFTLLFIGIILFFLGNIETYLELIEKPNFKSTIYLLFNYFPMIMFILILFYQIRENERSNIKIKRLEEKLKKLI